MSALEPMARRARCTGAVAAINLAARVVARKHGRPLAAVRYPAERLPKDGWQDPVITRCREETLYLARIAFDHPVRALAAALGIDHARVVRVINRVEGRRERSHVYDLLMDDMHLELHA